MTTTIQSDPVPLRLDDHGTLRAGDTRIPIDRIVECHQQGYTPEAIVEAFDTLRLADVYAVLAYYLNHKAEVTEYLRRQEEQAAAIRGKIETSQRVVPNREELAKRLNHQEIGGAATGN